MTAICAQRTKAVVADCEYASGIRPGWWQPIRYALLRWEGLTASSTTAALRSTPTQSNGQSARSPSITKNALFAGCEGGGENSAVIASLIETSKLCGVDSYANLADVLAKIVNGH